MSFYIFHRHRVCLVDCVDLICSLYSWWEGFGSSSLATLPLGFNCGFISTPLTEKPGRPQFTGLQRVGHNRSDLACVDVRVFLHVAAVAP